MARDRALAAVAFLAAVLLLPGLCAAQSLVGPEAAGPGTLEPAPSGQASSSLPTRTPFADCGNCPAMVAIPPGSFLMGSTQAETDREGVPPFRGITEIPQHKVALLYTLALGQFAVTRAEFAFFVAKTGYVAGGGCATYDGSVHDWRPDAALDWSNPGFAQSDADPVVCVSRRDAEAYAAWLAQLTHKNYRLPSEAEWEYAARAGTTSLRYFPDDRRQFCRYANGADLAYDARHVSAMEAFPNNLACSDGYVYTAPVGSFPPNPFGLYDMIGNVSELTADDWHPDYRGAPADGSAWTGDRKSTVLRGGSWYVSPGALRSARRIGAAGDARYSDTGFRVALTLNFVGS
jgi:formylglycine-generating enzyme required for sulfatase activity